MTLPQNQLPLHTKQSTDKRDAEQTHDINSPNDMVMDTDDYIGVADEPEKVAIINPDNLEQSEVDQLQDMPLANDRAYSIFPLASCNWRILLMRCTQSGIHYDRVPQANCTML
jgi:hypothetical protein